MAQVVPTVIDFGIVHKGDVIATRNVAVPNVAPVSALNDVLRGSFGVASGPFTAAGDLGAGVAAGATDATSFTVALDTAQAGVFNGVATATLSSHNADLADLVLAPVDVTLLAQVNEFANAAFVKQGGEGSFSRSGLTYTLDLGSILLGTGLHSVSLGVLNDVLGPADLLSGEFDLGLTDDFLLTGFDPFSDLGAGDLKDGLIAALDTDLLTLGTYVDTIILRSVGHNASGYRAALDDITLILRASIIERTGTVPEPGTLALVLLGMLALMRRMRRVAR